MRHSISLLEFFLNEGPAGSFTLLRPQDIIKQGEERLIRIPGGNEEISIDPETWDEISKLPRNTPGKTVEFMDGTQGWSLSREDSMFSIGKWDGVKTVPVAKGEWGQLFANLHEAGDSDWRTLAKMHPDTADQGDEPVNPSKAATEDEPKAAVNTFKKSPTPGMPDRPASFIPADQRPMVAQPKTDSDIPASDAWLQAQKAAAGSSTAPQPVSRPGGLQRPKNVWTPVPTDKGALWSATQDIQKGLPSPEETAAKLDYAKKIKASRPSWEKAGQELERQQKAAVKNIERNREERAKQDTIIALQRQLDDALQNAEEQLNKVNLQLKNPNISSDEKEKLNKKITDINGKINVIKKSQEKEIKTQEPEKKKEPKDSWSKAKQINPDVMADLRAAGDPKKKEPSKLASNSTSIWKALADKIK